MKNKKIIISILSLSLLIMGGAKVSQAATKGYSFRLPSTGYRTTESVVKDDNGQFLNQVNYNGRPDYRIDFWGTNNNSRYTTQSYFYGTGAKYANYGTNPEVYNGKDFYMTIKTGPTTFVEIDVNGYFAP